MSNLEQSIEELKNLKQSFKGKFQSKGISTLDVEFRNFPNLIDQMGVSPSGTLLIEENGTFDVAEYANAEVNVNIAKPSGKYNIEQTMVDGGCEIHVTEAGTDTTLYHCKAIDYDGSVLKEGWYSKGQEFVLPEFPTHDRLIAQEWSATSEIVENKIIVDRDLIAGVVYTTKSGLTEFDMILTEDTGLTVALNINGTKDWGDGTTDTKNNHTYTNYGKYIITSNATEIVSNQSATSGMSIFDLSPEEGSNNCVAIRTGSNVTRLGDVYLVDNVAYITLSNSVQTLKGILDYNVICDSLLQALIVPSSVIDFDGQLFVKNLVVSLGVKHLPEITYCNDVILPNTIETTDGVGYVSNKKIFVPRSVKDFSISNGTAEEMEFEEGVISVGDISNFNGKIIFSDSITSIGAIENCNVSELNLPSQLTSLGTIRNCKYLKELVIPDNITSLASNIFSNCQKLSKIVFPKHLITLPSSLGSLGALSGVCVLDFSKCENVCSSSGIWKLLKHPLTIAIVPDNLYDNWVADSNWSNYTSQIKKVSEV